MGATSGAVTAYPSGDSWIHPRGRVFNRLSKFQCGQSVHHFCRFVCFFISAKFMKDATTVICEPFTLVFFTSVFRYINEVLYLNEPINSATNNSFIHVFLKLTAQRITNLERDLVSSVPCLTPVVKFSFAMLWESGLLDPEIW
jgi:hypothetical protein